MITVRCDTSDGLRASEVIASVKDVHGKTHQIRVERDFLSANGQYLPVGVVGIDEKQKLVLVEFPHEPETMTSRIWVRQDDVNQSESAELTR